jgi:hypothetical protein
MRTPNWTETASGVFCYRRLRIERCPKSGRPNDLKVWISPVDYGPGYIPETDDRGSWILLDADELVGAVEYAYHAQRQDFTDEERQDTDIVGEIGELAYRPSFVAIALGLDEFRARFANVIWRKRYGEAG